MSQSVDASLRSVNRRSDTSSHSGSATCESVVVGQLQDLVQRCLDAIEADHGQRNARWSLRAWEEQHGISNGTLGQLAKGKRRGVAVETVPVIAKALRVTEGDIEAAIRADRSDSGKRAVAPRPGDASSPAPPPTSDVRITDDATDAIVNDAFNPARHKASDVPPVVEALQRTAALFRDNVDPVAYAARLLDAQAEARTKGRKVSPEELPFAALGMTERLLRLSEEKNARDTAEARAFIEREGLPALKPGEVHPEIKRAQERERKRREGR